MERGYIVFNQTFKPTAHQCASIAIQYDVTVIIIIQVIYIALFTAASQRLQFTISKQKEKRKYKQNVLKKIFLILLSKKKGF